MGGCHTFIRLLLRCVLFYVLDTRCQIRLQTSHFIPIADDNWVKMNYGVDPLHPDHSINCTAPAALHLQRYQHFRVMGRQC